MNRKKRKSKIKRYPTDLNDKKWDIISPLLPEALPGGRPRKISVRKLINAILYVTRSGCAWRLLPHEFPPWQTVYGYYRRWTKNGVWQRIHDTLLGSGKKQGGINIQPLDPSIAKVSRQRPWRG